MIENNSISTNLLIIIGDRNKPTNFFNMWLLITRYCMFLKHKQPLLFTVTFILNLTLIIN